MYRPNFFCFHSMVWSIFAVVQWCFATLREREGTEKEEIGERKRKWEQWETRMTRRRRWSMRGERRTIIGAGGRGYMFNWKWREKREEKWNSAWDIYVHKRQKNNCQIGYMRRGLNDLKTRLHQRRFQDQVTTTKISGLAFSE